MIPDLALAAPGYIVTVAGNWTPSYSGDNGLATLAGLSDPHGVAVDSAGNLYIADTANNRIRKVDAATKKISTVAGNGSGTFSGDGPDATLVGLNPWGVAVDSAGTLYIADFSNHRIRKVTTGGIISTVAGDGVGTYSGDGGAATAASLQDPSGVAVDSSGNLFIVDKSNRRIRKVTAATGLISTVAGNGISGSAGDGGPATSANLRAPSGVAVDGAGNFYIADQLNNKIRKVTAAGIITTVAGNGTATYTGDGGLATSTGLNFPSSVIVDSSGTLYISDFSNYCIRKVTTDGIISTMAGNGVAGGAGEDVAATATTLQSPQGLAMDSAGNLFIAVGTGFGANRILKVIESIKPVLTASPAAGTYSSTQYVTFSASKPVTIYYTLDGSDPQASVTRLILPPLGVLEIFGTKTLKFYGIDSDGNKSAVTTQAYTIPQAAVPGAPTGAVATAGNAQATVSFSAPVSNGGSQITGYTVTSSPSGGIDSDAGSTGLSHVITGLTNTISYSFKVTATNAAGTSPLSAASNTVTPVDTTPPSLILSTLASGSTTSNATLNVSGTAADMSGIQSVTVNDQFAAIGLNGSFSLALALQPGNNTVTTVATDSFNNASTVTRIITLDTTAPTLTITAPADNSLTNQGTVTVTGTVSQTSTVQVRVGTGAWQNAQVSSGNFSIILNLSPGLNTIEVTATDTAGNNVLNSAKRTINYDSSAPDLAVSYPPQDISTSQPSVLLTGVVSDPAASVTITCDGVMYVPAVTAGTFSQAIPFTTGNTYAVTVTATDGGYLHSVLRNIIFANSKPGDCDGNGTVSIDEVQSGINMFLGLKQVQNCVDMNNGGSVTIDEVQKVINAFLGL